MPGHVTDDDVIPLLDGPSERREGSSTPRGEGRSPSGKPWPERGISGARGGVGPGSATTVTSTTRTSRPAFVSYSAPHPHPSARQPNRPPTRAPGAARRHQCPPQPRRGESGVLLAPRSAMKGRAGADPRGPVAVAPVGYERGVGLVVCTEVGDDVVGSDGLYGWVVLALVLADPSPTSTRAPLIPRPGHLLPEGLRPSLDTPLRGAGRPPSRPPPPRLRLAARRAGTTRRSPMTSLAATDWAAGSC